MDNQRFLIVDDVGVPKRQLLAMTAALTSVGISLADMMPAPKVVLQQTTTDTQRIADALAKRGA